LWTTVPESVCRVMGSSRAAAIQEELGQDLTEVYFRQQWHGDLPAFALRMLDAWK
jgi:hypothetical protein